MATTFKTLNDIKKKQRMLLLLDESGNTYTVDVIAYATSASVSYSGDDIDVSNKTDGTWTTSMQGKKSAEISVDALCSYATGKAGGSALQEAFSNNTTFRFIYAYFDVEEAEDGIGTTLAVDANMPYYLGHMNVSSLELTSDNGDVCKFSCTANSIGSVAEYKKGDLFAAVDWTTEAFHIRLYELNDGVKVGNNLFILMDDDSYLITATCDGETATETDGLWTFGSANPNVRGKLMEVKVIQSGNTLFDGYFKVPDDFATT